MVIRQPVWNGILLGNAKVDIMPLFPVKHFSWREPKEFVELLDRNSQTQAPWHFISLVAVLNIAVLTGVSAMKAANSGRESITVLQATVMTLLGIGYVVYGHPWLVAKMPSTVEVKGGHVVRIHGGTTILALKEVKSFAWRTGDTHYTLVLHRFDGVERIFGVPSDVERDALTSFLRSRAIDEAKIKADYGAAFNNSSGAP